MRQKLNGRRLWGWIYFLVDAVATYVAARYYGANADLSSRAGVWFGVGLYLLLAAFVLEPWFSGAQVGIANSLAVFVGVFASGRPSYVGWWNFLLLLAIVAGVSLAVAGLFDEDAGEDVGGDVARSLKALGRRLGSWKVLLVGLMALSLASLNPPESREWSIGAAVIVYAVIVSAVRPDQLFSGLKRNKGQEFVVRVGPPSQLVVVGNPASFERPGDEVRVEVAGVATTAWVVGKMIVGVEPSWSILVPDLWETLARRVGPATSEITMTVSKPERERDSGVVPDAGDVVGLTAEGTTSGEMKVSLAECVRVSVGELLWTERAGNRLYWQVADSAVTHEAWPGERARASHASALQVGAWDDKAMRFRRDLSSPPVAELVYTGAGGVDAPHKLPAPAGLVQLGTLMGSRFPLLVDPVLLGRQHVAVVGVTGTGKTHLTFSMVEALTDVGTSVLCVDMTGQYSDRFPQASQVPFDQPDQFFDAKPGSVGICDPGIDNMNPVEQAKDLVAAIYQHVKTLGRLASDKPARLVVILEEAHNYIPESVLKGVVQETSKVFMESRKFGLGFVIVSQRTAMVTKSALSQCGSMFAFRSVDPTGIDFFEGFCGRAQVKVLPLLTDKTALAFGRAIHSDGPVVMTVTETANAVP